MLMLLWTGDHTWRTTVIPRHSSTFWMVCWERQTLLLMGCLHGGNRLMVEEPVVQKQWLAGVPEEP